MLRTGCSVVLLSGIVLLTLLGVLELILRGSPRYSTVNPFSAIHWQAERAAGGIQLATPQPFVTDENGILVAAKYESLAGPDGYRTPPFDEPDYGRKTVMFLGDSFTWGSTAEPIWKAYPDLVRSAGYRVVNLGIPCTGPAQYVAQARLYVPRLHPDAVCVMVYAGNDLMQEPAVLPGRNRLYITATTGFVRATTPDGRALTFDEAVAQRTKDIPAWLTPGVARLLSQTAIGRLASTLSQPTIFAMPDRARLEDQFRGIRAACAENGAELFVFVVPVREEFAAEYANNDDVMKFLHEFGPIAPPALREPEDFAPMPDCHFNNDGHARMAEHILAQLAGAGLLPVPGAPAWPNETQPIAAGASMDELARLLKLDVLQRTTLVHVLDRLKVKLAALYSMGDKDGNAPIMKLAANAPIGGGAAREQIGAFLESAAPDGAGFSYAVIAREARRHAYYEIARMLPDDALALVKRIPLAYLDTFSDGFDPVQERANASRGGRSNVTLEMAARILDLSAEQTSQFRGDLHALKDDICEILARPEKGGGPSPFEFARAGNPRERQLDQLAKLMFDYAGTHQDETTGRVYTEQFNALIEGHMERLRDMLRPEQREYVLALPTYNLLVIDIGYDPVSDRLGAGGASR